SYNVFSSGRSLLANSDLFNKAAGRGNNGERYFYRWRRAEFLPAAPLCRKTLCLGQALRKTQTGKKGKAIFYF
ncbi:hypothetical protein, partial [Pantoea agglomerans]|uniref:hypothetical protein n=1 Tax=Enterobacter agglomerans TaxID=549 RepID=UPI001A7EB460